MEPTGTGTSEYEEGAKLFEELTECLRNLWFELKAEIESVPDLGSPSQAAKDHQKEYRTKLRKALQSCNEWADGHKDTFSNNLKWGMIDRRKGPDITYDGLWFTDPCDVAALNRRFEKDSTQEKLLLTLAIKCYRVAQRFHHHIDICDRGKQPAGK